MRAIPKKPASKNKTGKEGLKLDLLPDLIGYQLRLAQRAVFGNFATELQDYDISPGRFGVMVLIAANPGLTQSLLAAATQLDRSTMVAVIDQLEARGLVERRASPTDRRSNALVLTPEGEKLLKRLKRLVRAHEARIVTAMTPAENAKLIELLVRIRRQLQSDTPERTKKK
ncbi:MAG: MarR family transcriptional regulator [Zoogloeaceae bacterium]|jgi:DNA-binding MarR family transcriptional regulator|nr:MarR family transcriptional regulator [Zoogloeaceae bacterium]